MLLRNGKIYLAPVSVSKPSVVLLPISPVVVPCFGSVQSKKDNVAQFINFRLDKIESIRPERVQIEQITSLFHYIYKSLDLFVADTAFLETIKQKSDVLIQDAFHHRPYDRASEELSSIYQKVYDKVTERIKINALIDHSTENIINYIQNLVSRKN